MDDVAVNGWKVSKVLSSLVGTGTRYGGSKHIQSNTIRTSSISLNIHHPEQKNRNVSPQPTPPNIIPLAADCERNIQRLFITADCCD